MTIALWESSTITMTPKHSMANRNKGEARRQLGPSRPLSTRGSADLAVLVHGTEWKASADTYAVGDGVFILRAAETAVARLYQSLCREIGIDDGGSLGFETVVQFKHFVGLGYPLLEAESPVARVLGLIAVLGRRPPGLCRWIASSDGFRTGQAGIALDFTRPAESFDERAGYIQIDDGFCQELQRAWNATGGLRHGRISTALNFFQHASFAQEYDVACLSLAIVLETLCAPHSGRSEITHQLAFNVASLFGGNASARRDTYARVKRLYGLRSSVTHGTRPSEDALAQGTQELFALTVDLLARVVVDVEMTSTLNDEARRRQLLDGFLFLE